MAVKFNDVFLLYMMNSPTFKQVLSQQEFSTQELLECLQTHDHLIYLNNHFQPIIGFPAEHFVLIQNNDIQFSSTQFQCLQDFFDASLNLQSPCLTMGFVSYDYAANQQVQAQEKSQPSLFLGQYLHYLSYENDIWYFNSFDANAQYIFQELDNHLKNKATSKKLTLNTPCQSRWDKTQYANAFQKVQDYIVAGDCYQINLTQEFTAQATGSLLSTTDTFWTLTNAPYSGYLRINDFELLSCSPELFIDFEANKKIVTKPIKGTMPRYADLILDEQSKNTLKHSEKDQAENVMIVDLLRNDLSVYAEAGSVKTPKLFNIESFNQVHHMVSEIEATLKAEVNPFEVLMSALPGGSITGAPKIRAMQIIDELEQGARGAYCGSMGYFNSNGTGSWNILIRSIQKFQDELSVWAGGGITIASDCNAEYQECFDKVDALLNLLNTYYKPE